MGDLMILQTGKVYFGGRLYLTPVQESDGMAVTLWRNSPSARAAFFNRNVVTPDSHAAWLRAKPPHDCVWMARDKDGGKLVGMAGLLVDPAAHIAEAGRFFVAPEFRSGGYGLEIDWTVLAYAFDVLQLEKVWIDAFQSNAPIIKMHGKAGYAVVGVDMHNHTHPRGPVVHMEMIRMEWYNLVRQRFIEARGVTLPDPLA